MDAAAQSTAPTPRRSSGSSSAESAEGVPAAAALPQETLKRGLHTRHMTLIAIAATIGPGLLLASGTALSTAGPVGALLSYVVVGIVVLFTMQSLGELATAFPASQSHLVDFSSRFLDEAAGVVTGWAYWALWVLVLANELVATGILFSFWPEATVIPQGGYIALFLALFLGISLAGVAAWGEVEFWLALVKVAFILAFFCLSIAINSGLGSGYIGFRYWRDPGPFNGSGSAGFSGFVTVLTLAATQFSGCEVAGITAGEAKDPQRAVPKATRSIVWRICIFYVGTILFCGINVPYNDPRLTQAASRAAASPLTIAMQRGGLDGAADAINAIVIIAVMSAGNSSLFIASRTVAALARQGMAPRVLAWTTAKGKVPIPALVFSAAVSLISLLSIGGESSRVFAYIYSVSGVCILVVWALLVASHIRFRKALAAQGRSVDELLFRAWIYPYGAYFALAGNIVLALIQGYSAFAPRFSPIDFVVYYIVLPVSALLFVGWKLWHRTRIPRLVDIDLDTGAVLQRERSSDGDDDVAAKPPPPPRNVVLRSLKRATAIFF